MMLRICVSAMLVLWASGPLAAQRRSDLGAASAAVAAPEWRSPGDPHRVLLPMAGEYGRPADAPRFGPAIGMVVGGVAGAAVGVVLSRATCDPSRCDGMADVAAFFLGGLTGAALGYMIAGGKNLPGTRPPVSPPVRRSR
jgi:hypothetical protein